MPIKELLALSALILASIAAAHPFDFKRAVLRTEYSVLKQVSRTDDWGDLSFATAKLAAEAAGHHH